MDRLQVASAARAAEINAKLPVEMEKYKLSEIGLNGEYREDRI